MAGGVSLLSVAIFMAVDGGAAVPPPWAPRAGVLVAPSPDGGAPADRGRSYDLRPAKDGTGDLVWEAPGFVARVARDGTARFVDKGGVQFSKGWSLIPFVPLPNPAGTSSLQGVITDLLSRVRRPRSPRRPAEEPRDPPLPVPNMSRYRPDPREVCQPGTPCFWEGTPLLLQATGSFDLTDELMRMNGQDPYRSAKAMFLTDTRDRRAGMAARALAADVRHASSELMARLEAIACDERRSVAERRAVIDALRGELDGNTPEARDAAAMIRRFVAERFDAADGGVRCSPR